MLKYFPVNGGFSAILIPKTTMSGDKLQYKKHIGLNNGQYCQVRDNEEPRNIQVPHTKGAIFLEPSGN